MTLLTAPEAKQQPAANISLNMFVRIDWGEPGKRIDWEHRAQHTSGE